MIKIYVSMAKPDLSAADLLLRERLRHGFGTAGAPSLAHAQQTIGPQDLLPVPDAAIDTDRTEGATHVWPLPPGLLDQPSLVTPSIRSSISW